MGRLLASAVLAAVFATGCGSGGPELTDTAASATSPGACTETAPTCTQVGTDAGGVQYACTGYGRLDAYRSADDLCNAGAEADRFSFSNDRDAAGGGTQSIGTWVVTCCGPFTP